jgi:hypothetical protein
MRPKLKRRLQGYGLLALGVFIFIRYLSDPKRFSGAWLFALLSIAAGVVLLAMNRESPGQDSRPETDKSADDPNAPERRGATVGDESSRQDS